MKKKPNFDHQINFVLVYFVLEKKKSKKETFVKES